VNLLKIFILLSYCTIFFTRVAGEQSNGNKWRFDYLGR